ncbi:MAG: creatininase family protein [bacterium]|nr:creatininase family protein [bacterium]
MTWTEVRDLDPEATVAILPVGAVEAHGPHLPLSTDRIIAAAMAEDGARRLAGRGLTCLLLPPVDYTSAGFAAAFPGTVSIRPETVTSLLADVGAGLARTGFRRLAVANAHFDPGHLQSIYDALGRIRSETKLAVAFPDVTRKPWASRLSDEFKSGACHAGQYEGSVVMARREDLVRDDVRRRLPANPESLSRAIWKGHESFEEAGGPEAYFGDPAAATAAEGEETIAVLGQILERAVLELIGSRVN